MDKLSDELLTQILTRLPAKDITRSKSISKRIHTIITSNPNFTKLHLSHLHSTPLSHLTLIIKGFSTRHLNPPFMDSSTHLYTVDFTSLDQITPLNPPFIDPSTQSFELAGSCNGVLCLALHDQPDKWVCLFNPLTGSHRVLPSCPLLGLRPSKDQPFLGFGFGYDVVHDDYKVVRVTQVRARKGGKCKKNETYVYSCKDDNWVKGKNVIPYDLNYRFEYAFCVNGFLHWLLMDGSGGGELQTLPLIVGYDVSNDKHHVVPAPRKIDLGFDTLTICDFDGMLFIGCNCAGVKSDVWVMKEYMVQESWVILFSIRQYEIDCPLRFIRPIGFVRNGTNVLFKDESGLVLYSLKRKRGVSVNVKGMQNGFYDVSLCLRSLVSLDRRGGGGIQGQHQSKETMRNWDEFLSKGFEFTL